MSVFFISASFRTCFRKNVIAKCLPQPLPRQQGRGLWHPGQPGPDPLLSPLGEKIIGPRTMQMGWDMGGDIGGDRGKHAHFGYFHRKPSIFFGNFRHFVRTKCVCIAKRQRSKVRDTGRTLGEHFFLLGTLPQGTYCKKKQKKSHSPERYNEFLNCPPSAMHMIMG